MSTLGPINSPNLHYDGVSISYETQPDILSGYVQVIEKLDGQMFRRFGPMPESMAPGFIADCFNAWRRAIDKANADIARGIKR